MNKLALAALITLLIAGCASKPAAAVSKKELAASRQVYRDIKAGASRQEVLASLKSGNKVKLGSSTIDGVVIEEWKYEAFHDEDNRKDLFITFLYFCDDRFVDGSDTRIDFRNNPDIVSRWVGRQTK